MFRDTCFATIVILSISSTVHAALILGNDAGQIAGDDGFNLTIDTDTNLQWLDLSVTDNRSYNEVESSFASGGDLEGYRHATRSEVLTLWENAGINYTLNFQNQPENWTAILDLMDLLSLTFEIEDNGDGVLRRIAMGWFDDSVNRPAFTSPSRAKLEQRVNPVPDGLCPLVECVSAAVFEETIFSRDSHQGATGHYLVALSPAPPTTPVCDIQLNQPTYIDADTVTADVFRIANPTAASLAVEWKVWLAVPGVSPISIINLGSDSSFMLPAGSDIDLGPLPLLPVSPALPRGSYAFSCRMLDPVTGSLLSEDLNNFEIQ